MKTRRDLNLEYWGPIHDMCKGTALEGREWECVKFKGDEEAFEEHPGFRSNDNYELAVAILEDKPVFADTCLYDTQGRKYSYYKTRGDFGHQGDFFYNQSVELITKGKSSLSWHPPAPKRTFLLDGIELPCPTTGDKKLHGVCFNDEYFWFDSYDDHKIVVDALSKIFKEAKSC